jgi:hypothetical protein
MNIAGSLVESYMYSDMFNREYDSAGGSYLQEKIHVGGSPVEYILPSLKKQNGGKMDEDKDQTPTGGNGPFQNKVVPVGLVLIPTYKDQEVEFADDFHPGVNREVISESVFDALFGSVSSSEHKKNRYTTPPKYRQSKQRSRKQK